MNLTKLYLVQFTLSVGEYGQSSHIVIKAHCVEEAKLKAHRYFMDYYGDENTKSFKEAEEYTYNGGDVMVDVGTPQEITPDELVKKLLINGSKADV